MPYAIMLLGTYCLGIVHSQAVNDLGIAFRSIEETLVDMARLLIVAGQVTPKFDGKHVTAADGGQ